MSLDHKEKGSLKIFEPLVSDYLVSSNIKNLLLANNLIEINLIYVDDNDNENKCDNNSDNETKENVGYTLSQLQLRPNYNYATGQIYRNFNKHYCNIEYDHILDLFLTQYLFIRYMGDGTRDNDRIPYLPLFPLGKIIAGDNTSPFFTFGWSRDIDTNELEIGTVNLFRLLVQNQLCLIIPKKYRSLFLLSCLCF